MAYLLKTNLQLEQVFWERRRFERFWLILDQKLKSSKLRGRIENFLKKKMKENFQNHQRGYMDLPLLKNGERTFSFSNWRSFIVDWRIHLRRSNFKTSLKLPMLLTHFKIFQVYFIKILFYLSKNLSFEILIFNEDFVGKLEFWCWNLIVYYILHKKIFLFKLI